MLFVHLSLSISIVFNISSLHSNLGFQNSAGSVLDLKLPRGTISGSFVPYFHLKMATLSDASTSEPLHKESFLSAQPQEVTFLEEKRARIEAIDLEKRGHEVDKEEDSEQDLDVLIHELESADSDIEVDDEKETADSKPVIPSQLLQTDPALGLTTPEVIQRRRKYGLNQLKEEKENMFLKFILFFVGPIQFVMEVSFEHCSFAATPADLDTGSCYSRRRLEAIR